MNWIRNGWAVAALFLAVVLAIVGKSLAATLPPGS